MYLSGQAQAARPSGTVTLVLSAAFSAQTGEAE